MLVGLTGGECTPLCACGLAEGAVRLHEPRVTADPGFSRDAHSGCAPERKSTRLAEQLHRQLSGFSYFPVLHFSYLR